MMFLVALVRLVLGVWVRCSRCVALGLFLFVCFRLVFCGVDVVGGCVCPVCFFVCFCFTV